MNIKDIRTVRENTVQLLTIRGIPINTDLPLLDIKGMQLKDAVQIGKRANLLNIFIAVSNDAESISFFYDIIKSQNCYDELTKSERHIFETKTLSKQAAIDLSWAQESLYTILWCLGIIDIFDFPNQECNLSDAFRKIPPEVEWISFLGNLKIQRTTKEIASWLDIYYCLHWADRKSVV